VTALQIIQEIQNLPAGEKEQVIRAVAKLAGEPAEPKVQYASKEEVERVSAKVFEKYDDLFRKLAQ
jgi:hypothetical protein